MTSTEPQSRILLFVVGMHRSGTSALAASLHGCGASVGDALLPAQDSVNEDGFFEDVRVVEINERILEAVDWTWYAPGDPEQLDWQSSHWQSFADEIDALLAQGFGDGEVQLVKDPRFCITLPIWLSACRRLGISDRVCTIERPGESVARSLEKRDGFPPSYGRWLCEIYQKHISANVPDGSASITFQQLLEDAKTSVQRVIDALNLPLEVEQAALDKVVRKELNHSGAVSADVETPVSVEDMLREFAEVFVHRGHELTRIADQHTHALSVVDERDADLADKVSQLETLGGDHSRALATIEERDGQLQQANERILELGEAHGYAISVVEDRDRTISEVQDNLESLRQEKDRLETEHQQTVNQLEGTLGILRFKINRLENIPLLGRLFKKYFTYE